MSEIHIKFGGTKLQCTLKNFKILYLAWIEPTILSFRRMQWPLCRNARARVYFISADVKNTEKVELFYAS
jgi:hypothetical protein